MKKLLAIALCLAFAAGAAEAKTYYVDAARPNNNGNGLKPATAKKTIQAAINLAQDGDTILVYPGEYAPIKTQNKKITIKSVKGASKTKIVKTAKLQDVALAQLGKTYTIQTTRGSYSSTPFAKGKNTTLAGFLLDGKNRSNGYHTLAGITGGTVKSCSVQRLGKPDSDYLVYVVSDASLAGCTLIGNRGYIADDSVLVRCQIKNNTSTDGNAFRSSRLCNCLVTGNGFYGYYEGLPSLFNYSVVVNCTITENRTYRWSASERTSIAYSSKFYNCVLRNNYRQTKTWEGQLGKESICNVSSGNGYSRTYKDNKDPKFVNAAGGNYKLAKGSPCIDQGTVPAAIKSYVGSTDLAGGKRVKGKAIDMGCYEY